jgi:hypothetical protein
MAGRAGTALGRAASPHALVEKGVAMRDMMDGMGGMMAGMGLLWLLAIVVLVRRQRPWSNICSSAAAGSPYPGPGHRARAAGQSLIGASPAARSDQCAEEDRRQ